MREVLDLAVDGVGALGQPALGKRPRGRPRVRHMPEPIADAPENVLRALGAPWPPKVSAEQDRRGS